MMFKQTHSINIVSASSRYPLLPSGDRAREPPGLLFAREFAYTFHGPYRRVEGSDDRTTFLTYYQVSEQIESGTFVPPASSKIGPSSLNAIPNVRKIRRCCASERIEPFPAAVFDWSRANRTRFGCKSDSTWTSTPIMSKSCT
jgi:hypothetical protein